MKEDQLYLETIKRGKFFQNIQSWPLENDLNYEGWLSNFPKGEERDIACRILSFFCYYSKEKVNKMLSTTVGHAGYHIKKNLPGWKHSDFRTNCYFSYIQGENPNPTDSGNYFARKLRDELRISEQQIIQFSKITTIARRDMPIILVDDFVGSGSQIYTAWNKHNSGGAKTLSEISSNDKVCFVYVPLIVNQQGYNVITHDCQGLHLSTCHVLGNEYNLFNRDCYCWNSDASLFDKGIKLITNKSKQLKIPFTNGVETVDAEGFGRQGLAMSFEHGAPDAIPAIFYWKEDGWVPLVKKNYVR